MLLLLLALGVQTVKGEIQRAQYDTFPGKKFTMNESSSFTPEAARSKIECGSLCLQTALCSAANYDKDAGVCHKLTRAIPCSSTMEDSNSTVAMRAKQYVPVGLWPLQAAYQGEDVSGYGHHLDLIGMTFPAGSVTPWGSPAAYFPATGTYAVTELTPCVTLHSYSWMVKVYMEEVDNPYYFFDTDNPADHDRYFRSFRQGNSWFVQDACLGSHKMVHPAILSPRTWHTLAVTFHYPTNTLTAWMDGLKEVVYLGHPCARDPIPPKIYIGNEGYSSRRYPMQGGLSCMGLFSDVVDYDVMYAVTMQHCGG